MRLASYILVLSAALGLGSASFGAKLPAAHCTISIVMKQRAGETKVLSFKSRLSTPAACRVLAELHAPNFTPNDIVSKKVSYRWDGPAGKKHRRKRSSSLARRVTTH